MTEKALKSRYPCKFSRTTKNTHQLRGSALTMKSKGESKMADKTVFDMLSTILMLVFMIGLNCLAFAFCYIEHQQNKALASAVREAIELQNKAFTELARQKTLVLIKNEQTGGVELRAMSTCVGEGMEQFDNQKK